MAYKASLLLGWRGATAFNVAKTDATLGKVIGGEFHLHLVASEDADVIFDHLARGVGNHHVSVFQPDTKTRIRQHLGHQSVDFNEFFLAIYLSFNCR